MIRFGFRTGRYSGVSMGPGMLMLMIFIVGPFVGCYWIIKYVYVVPAVWLYREIRYRAIPAYRRRKAARTGES